MLTINFTSRMLNRALQTLAVIVILFATFLVVALATSALAEDGQTEEVIRLVNVERAKVGAPALAENEELVPAANERAREASVKFSHTRPNGSKWKTVFDEYKIVSTYRGENLAEGQKSPEAVVKAWMASEGHRKNILNPEFDHIAVGQYEKDGVLYWSQLFVRTPETTALSGQAIAAALTGKPVAGQRAQVTEVDLNVREAASAKSGVKALAVRGSTVDVLEICGNWAHIRMADGTEGWASIKYLAA